MLQIETYERGGPIYYRTYQLAKEYRLSTTTKQYLGGEIILKRAEIDHKNLAEKKRMYHV